MTKLTKPLLEAMAQNIKQELKNHKAVILVCGGAGCSSAGSRALKDGFEKELKERGISKDYSVKQTGCFGFCAAGPIVIIHPQGVFYQKVAQSDVVEIVESHLLADKPVERLLYKDLKTKKPLTNMQDIPFFQKQQPIALRNKGLIDPENIEHYIARGGYQTIATILEQWSPDAVIKEIIASGLRGRGGGGFPTGFKWRSCRAAALDRKEVPFVVCNANDRSIIEIDQHSVIEGLMIGAYAVGAQEGYIFIRKEYPQTIARLQAAIARLNEKGLLGSNILGSNVIFNIHIHRGAGGFVGGESTAILASMSGKTGEPSPKYIHSSEFGFRNKPTVLNNVETWANIPVIMEKGAAWFASIGTGDVSKDPMNGSSGAKVFNLGGKIQHSGLVEVPLGTTFRELIFDLGGGVPNGRKIKAIQTGGPSGGYFPAENLDMKIDYDSLTKAGSIMGSGSIIVMDDRACMVDAARYFIQFLADESCGKCTPCREGLHAMSQTLTRICSGNGKQGDIEFLLETAETIRSTSLCQLGGTAANPVLSTIQHFREEYETHIHHKTCPAGACKPMISYSISETACTGCTLCAKKCPVKAIAGERKSVHVIDKSICIKCGICFEVCKFNAVEVK